MIATSSALAPTSSERLASPSEAAAVEAIVSTRTVKRRSVRMQCRLSNCRAPTFLLGGLVFILVLGQISSQTAALDEQAATAAPSPAQSKSQQGPSSEPATIRSTQPTVDRQVDSPNSAAPSVSQPTTQAKQAEAQQVSAVAANSITAKAAEASIGGKLAKPKQSAAAAAVSSSLKKAALASQQNYDKYQLKAHNTTPLGSSSSSAAAASSSSSLAIAAGESSSKDSMLSVKVSKDEPSSAASPGDKRQSASGSSSSGSQSSSSSSGSSSGSGSGSGSSSSSSSSSSHVAYKKSGVQQANGSRAKSSFSLLRRLLPSFMTSAVAAGPLVAAAAAASAAADKHQMSHSRSSQSLLTGPDGPLSKASGKIINLLSSKKTAGYGLVPDHAPFFTRKPSIDRQIGGFGASSLLSNPLSLGLLFSAPLIPSLLLTPLAIAGLSPAMSAINNFFGDDEEASSSSASTPGSSPLSVLTGPSSPLSSILQGSGAASAASSSSGTPSFALQAVQSFLGPPATTEKPLFNPGLFASQGIQNAMGSLSSSSSGSSSSSSSSSSSGGLSQPSNSPIRNLLSGNLIQTAASMISPSFAAPPGSLSGGGSGGSSGSSAAGSSDSSDDGPGFMQVASDVFDKVANYMSPEKEVAQASSSSSVSAPVSPLSSLVGLSNFSPFQLSSLLASSPLAAAFAPPPLTSSHSGSSSHSSSTAPTTQRAGFFSTLKNIYELFSSSFLRRQEIGDSNECQQRLICELHQRAMNSKLFRRSLQANLIELANLDKSIQEQIKNNPMQARVDTETKAMLSDFLKATNNFKNGRELASCSQMFPKCSRAMLLSAANAHLTDPANSKAIGKFSNLMKKMKFKSIQQHQSQWKLRKPNKPNTVQLPRSVPNQFQPIDYLQVAPLSPSVAGARSLSGQLTPADSLKLVQQILLIHQQQNQNQQQQQQQMQSQVQSQYGANQQQQIGGPMQFGSNLQQQQQQQPANQLYNLPQPMISSSYPNYAQFPQVNQQQMSTIYTDSIPQVYSATESPFYIPQPDMSQASSLQQQQQPQQQPQSISQQQMMQQPQLSNQQQQVNTQQQQQAQSSYQYQPASSSSISDHMVGISPQVDSNKKIQQQSVSTSSKVASAA